MTEREKPSKGERTDASGHESLVRVARPRSVPRVLKRSKASGASTGSPPDEWLEWFDFLEREMIDLCLVRDIYADIRRMIVRNPEIQKPSIFYSWMLALYFTRAVICIARLVDDKKTTKSFLRLLRRIEKQPHLVSRTQFVAAYISSEGMSSIPKGDVERIANKEFDEWAGKGVTCIQQADVERDIDDLLRRAKPVTTHRHERVAHLDRNPSKQLAGLGDLDRAIEKLAELFSKYSILLRRQSCDLFPSIQDDWKAIFRVPWEAPSKGT
ncbi:MAG: hypothetical protein ACHQZS_01570 [Candidatus Binatales bacterium]